MTHGNDPQQEGTKGVIEKLKGRVKETAATFMGNDSMQREGRSQQSKGSAQEQAADKEAEAKRAREQASAHEGQERGQQG